MHEKQETRGEGRTRASKGVAWTADTQEVKSLRLRAQWIAFRLGSHADRGLVLAEIVFDHGRSA